MGEDDVGVLGGLLVHGVDVAEGDTEDDVGVLTGQGVDGVGHGGVVAVVHVVHDQQLGLRVKAQLLHGVDDAIVVLVGVTGGVVLAVDVDGAHLEGVKLRAFRLALVSGGRAVRGGLAGGAAGVAGAGTRAGGIRRSGCAAAGGQGQDHGHCHDQCKQFLFHLTIPFYPK